MNDLISRADAIRIASGYCHSANIAKELAKLPSAQPEIIRCKECEYWDVSWQHDDEPNYHYCPLADGMRRGDFYCADAERR